MKNLITLLALSIGLTAAAQEKVNPPKNPDSPEISFEKMSHDFGKVKRNSPMNYDFVYKNTGKELLVVSKCRAGCECTTVSCSKEGVKAGKKGTISVSYDSTRVGKFKKEVMVQSNARNPMTLLFIEGEVLSDVPAPQTAPVKTDGKAGVKPE